MNYKYESTQEPRFRYAFDVVRCYHNEIPEKNIIFMQFYFFKKILWYNVPPFLFSVIYLAIF